MDLDKRIWNSPKVIQQIIYDFAYDLNEELQQIHFQLLEKINQLRIQDSKDLFESRLKQKDASGSDRISASGDDLISKHYITSWDYTKKVMDQPKVNDLVNDLFIFIKKYKLSRDYVGNIMNNISYSLATILNLNNYMTNGYHLSFSVDYKGVICCSHDWQIDDSINIYEYFLFDTCRYCKDKLKLRKYARASVELKNKEGTISQIYIRFCDKCIKNKDVNLKWFIMKEYNILEKKIDETESESEEIDETENETEDEENEKPKEIFNGYH